MKSSRIRVRRFSPPLNAKPLDVPIRLVPVVQYDSHQLRWQEHYDRAVQNCNTHASAVRYANLMVR